MLRQEIDHWDGKSADSIEAIYLKYQQDPQLLDVLLDCLAEPKRQSGASWLLKRRLGSGVDIDAQQLHCLMKTLPTLLSWQARLHVLQSFEYFLIAESDQKLAEAFLRHCLVDSNKFVRAWCYHGWFYLQQQFPQYHEEVKSFFSLALMDEAASVKARIRNLLKQQKFFL